MKVQSLNRVSQLLATQQLKTSSIQATQTLPQVYTTDHLQMSFRPVSDDYQAIFDWVERVTGKTLVYQTPIARQAYIHSIKQSRPLHHYDRDGFLASIGLTQSQTYGRVDHSIPPLLKQVNYKPDTGHISPRLKFLQKVFFNILKFSPGSFNAITKIVEPFLTRKDKKSKAWLKQPIPQTHVASQTPLSRGLARNQYNHTLIAQYQGRSMPPLKSFFNQHFNVKRNNQMSFMFERDFHMGVPKAGKPQKHYGTYSLARRLGFSHEQASRIGTADFDIDLNKTPYGKTASFPNERPSRHFDLNSKEIAKGDTRFIWARRHLQAAIDLARKGRFEQAELELGYGLHGLQDSFAHGHISMSMHAVVPEFPDNVKYNPVAVYEASVATVGYLNTYLKALL